MMQNMNSIGTLGGFSIMNYIGHQVVGGDLLSGLRLFREVLAQIDIPGCFHKNIFKIDSQRRETEHKNSS